jgi:MFS family permease
LSVVGSTILAARLVIFVTFLDLFIQFPVVAPFARGLGATPYAVGWIVGVYSLTNLLGNLAAGFALDRWGRKRPVLCGLLVSVLALAAYAAVATPGQLLAVRAAHGLATAVLTPGAFALIGDTAAVDHRARVMGVSGAIIAVAATVGPPLASALGDRFGVGRLFLGASGLMLVAALCFARWASETAAPAAPEDGAPSAGHLTVLTRWPLVTAYMAVLALTVGLGTLVTHLPQMLVARGDAGVRGAVFTAYAVLAVLAMAGPLGRLSDRTGRYGPIAGGLSLIGLGMLLLALVPSAVGALLGMAVFGFGFGLLFPPAAALVVEATDRSERGAAFGVFYAIYSFGVVVGSVLSGLLAEWGGEASAGPFLVGGTVALAAAPAVLAFGRRLVPAASRQPSL